MTGFTATEEQMRALGRAIRLVQDAQLQVMHSAPYAGIAREAARADEASLTALAQIICSHPDSEIKPNTGPSYECRLCGLFWAEEPRRAAPALEPAPELGPVYKGEHMFCAAKDGAKECIRLHGHDGDHSLYEPTPIEEMPF